jgi:rhodanese-related sulfurtransferase
VTEGQPTRPHYFAFDAQRNREQRHLLDETATPSELRLGEVLDLIAAGAVPLDTREAADFAAGHLRGAINVGLQGRFAEWAGDVLDPDRGIVLVGDPTTALESTVRLARIGFDRVIGYLVDPGQAFLDRPDLVETSSRVTIEQLAELVGLVPDLQLLDVRNPGETAAGTLAGAREIPLARLVDSLDEVARDAPVVVNCAHGTRSLIAASVLRHVGYADVSDLIGGFDAWTTAALPVTEGGARPEDVVEVTPAAADELIRAGATVIDVREQEEWTAGHVPDARLIPLSRVEARIDEITSVCPAVVVCRSGGRSRVIAQLLNSRRIDAVNLAGGMLAWEQAGLPVVTDAGSRGRIV